VTVGFEGGGVLRLANVGRALLMAACLDALNVWQSGVHVRGLVIGGAGTFVSGLLMFEGFERWDRRQKAAAPGPPPPLPPGVPGAVPPNSVADSGAKADN
jgi:hypothetical protein